MISLQKANFVTFKKPTLRKTTKTFAKYTKYDDVKQYEENVLSVFKTRSLLKRLMVASHKSGGLSRYIMN